MHINYTKSLAYDLPLINACFKKRDSYLFTYRSGKTATQIDFVLFPKSLHKLVDSWRGDCSAVSAPGVRHDD